MRSPRKVVVAVGCIAGAIALAGVVALAVTSREASAEQPTQPTPAPVAIQQPESEPEPEGPVISPSVPESEVYFLNATVEELLTGVFAAIERQDSNWLARALESTHGRELTEEDALAAYRNFLWRSASPMWAKARAAWDIRAYQVREEGEAATIGFEVGGALGTLEFQFKRIDGGWYFAGI